jgi:hypothetical protein
MTVPITKAQERQLLSALTSMIVSWMETPEGRRAEPEPTR